MAPLTLNYKKWEIVEHDSLEENDNIVFEKFDSIRRMANAHFEHQKYDEAIHLYINVLSALKRENKTYGDLFINCKLNLSTAYLRLQRYDAALKETQDVIKREPQNIQALHLYGCINYHLGFLEEAEKKLIYALKLSKEEGCLLQDLQLVQNAIKHYENAIFLLKQSKECSQENQDDKAITLLQLALKHCKPTKSTFLEACINESFGRVYCKKKDFNSLQLAIEHLKKAINSTLSYDHHLDLLEVLSCCYMNTNQLNNAIVTYKEAIELVLKNSKQTQLLSSLYLKLGNAVFNLGKSDEAIKILFTAKKYVDNDSPDTIITLLRSFCNVYMTVNSVSNYMDLLNQALSETNSKEVSSKILFLKLESLDLFKISTPESISILEDMKTKFFTLGDYRGCAISLCKLLETQTPLSMTQVELEDYISIVFEKLVPTKLNTPLLINLRCLIAQYYLLETPKPEKLVMKSAAQEHLKSALDFISEDEYIEERIILLKLLSQCTLDQDESITLLEQALRYERKRGPCDHLQISSLLYELAQAYAKTKNLDKAHESLIEAVSLFKKNNDLNSEIKATTALGMINIKRGDYAAAKNFLEEALRKGGKKDDMDKIIEKLEASQSKLSPSIDQHRKTSLTRILYLLFGIIFTFSCLTRFFIFLRSLSAIE